MDGRRDTDCLMQVKGVTIESTRKNNITQTQCNAYMHNTMRICKLLHHYTKQSAVTSHNTTTTITMTTTL
ncbi:hypothetical protein E2C01_038212 [Portunus trituberculatus]|uniref:Uncharacterized protein n=1 Tax=Portunus trituberculatus TaxID=210409 RepID=A0A5B7FHX2_PORTR|nr:hypothetical protein [Portunus trituberculatus]